MPKRIHEWMPRLAQEGVVGADAIFACLGPALEIFSRYTRVEKASGKVATLREYLEHVWAAVSTEALSMIFRDADAAGLEPDARLTAMWLWTLGGGKNGKLTAEDAEGAEEEADGPHPDPLPEGEGTETPRSSASVALKSGYVLEFDAARKIAQGLGIHLEKSESIVEVKGETARLLPVAERAQYLFGKDTAAGATKTGKAKQKAKQKSFFEELGEAEAAEAGWTELKGPPPGTTALDRLHQAMILFAAGHGELMKRFLVDNGVGRDAAGSGNWPNRFPPFTRPAPTRNAGWTECWRKEGAWVMSNLTFCPEGRNIRRAEGPVVLPALGNAQGSRTTDDCRLGPTGQPFIHVERLTRWADKPISAAAVTRALPRAGRTGAPSGQLGDAITWNETRTV